MRKIALYPGGYKPPHIGHYKAAKIASQAKDAETGESVSKVIVFVGISPRNNITQDMAIDLWKLYTAKDDNIEIRASKGSPVTDVYDYVELEAKDGDTLYFIKGKKDKDDPRFKNIPDYAKKFEKNIKLKPINIQDQFSRSGNLVSGTSMRSYIKNNDKESFIDGLPLGVDGEKAWNIVADLDEDLYNPKDKVNDYMRGSEWKAGMPDGPKDDKTSPVIKYNRGGMYTGGGMGYGGMYEDKGGESEIHIYDFDDTIAQVKTNIRVTITSPKGDYEKVLDVPSDKFPKVSAELEAKFSMMKFDYDFSEFEKDIEDAIISSEVLNKLKSSLSNPTVQTTILTARTEGEPVINFFKKIGLDPYIIPLGSMVGGNRVTGQDKQIG